MTFTWSSKNTNQKAFSESRASSSPNHKSNAVSATGTSMPLFLRQTTQQRIPLTPVMFTRDEKADLVGRQVVDEGNPGLQSAARSNEVDASNLTACTNSGLPRFLSRPLDDYPHGATISQALKRDVPGRAVFDPEGAARYAVPAYTEGSTSYFASPAPSLEVAAHEATHVLQHSGQTREAGLGAERHAAAVSRAVMAGSGAGLIGPGGSHVPSATRAFTVIEPAEQGPGEWDTGRTLRLSDDGFMATTQPSAHDAWAAPSLIIEANERLQSAGSAIHIRSGAETISGPAPNSGIRMELVELEPENTATGSSGELMHIWADCGRAAREVMGVGATRHTGVAAQYRAQVTPSWWYRVYAYFTGEELSEEQQRSTEAAAPSGMRREIFRETLGGGAEEAWHRYLDMSAEDRDAFDRQTGINEYVLPEVGETYVGRAAPEEGASSWNFHWAGVVMTSGHDRMTLENFTVGDSTVQNLDWQFNMYGPPSAPGQTFHEQLAESLGPEHVTMKVAPR